MYYTKSDMKTSCEGMKNSETKWAVFLSHLHATLDLFKVPRAECDDLVAFIESTKRDMVEA